MANRRKKVHGLYFHSSPPRVLPMNNPIPIKARDGGREAIVIKPSNIRIWIHDKDIGKLTKVLWEGQGMRLRTETSSNPKVKRFLEAVPYVMNLIKDIHGAAVDNDLDLLKSRTQPPVPRIVLSSKDQNGLTALHKAAGLAHTRLVEYLLSIWPNSAAEPDCNGRTPLHYAASAKNNDRCFNLLVQAGSDETTVDQKSRTAAFYKHKPNELDRSLLTVIPDAPRIPQTPHPSEFDWSLMGEDVQKPISKLKPTFYSENNISSILSKGPPIQMPAKLSQQNSFENSPPRNGHLSARSIQDNLDNTSEPDMTMATPETVIKTNGFVENGDENKNDEISAEEQAVLAAIHHPKLYAKNSKNTKKLANPNVDTEIINYNGPSSVKAINVLDKPLTPIDNVENGNNINDSLLNDNEDNLDVANIETIDNNTELEPDKISIENDNEPYLEDDLDPSDMDDADDDMGDGNAIELDDIDDSEDNDEMEMNERYGSNSYRSENEENLQTEYDVKQEQDQRENSTKTNKSIRSVKSTMSSKSLKSNKSSNSLKSMKSSTSIRSQNPSLTNTENIDENQNENHSAKSRKSNHPEDTTSATDDNINPGNETVDVENHVMNEENSTEINNSENDSANVEKNLVDDQKDDDQADEENNNENNDDDKESIKSMNNNDDNANENHSKSSLSKKINDDAESDNENEDDMKLLKGTMKTGNGHITDEDNENNDEDEIDDHPPAQREEDMDVESPSPALEIEGVVEGEPTDNGQLQSQGGALSMEDEDARLQVIIDSGDMEQLATLVLTGQGAKLVGMACNQPEIQAFLDNVPAYMNKIRKVHLSAREGNLRDLQSALDRRKFAIAKDTVSPNGATPLHVSTIFGHSAIVRYLAGRFPETTSAVDTNGRTALHYAATIHDNGHFYNLLSHLGANSKAVDNLGHSPEFYLNHQQAKEILSHRQLLKDYGAEEELADEMLNDQDIDNTNPAQQIEIPLFRTEEGRYLATTLGDPLIKGLTEVANTRPDDPIAFLANYLYNFANKKSAENPSGIVGTELYNQKEEDIETATIETSELEEESHEENNNQLIPKPSISNNNLQINKMAENIPQEDFPITPDGPESAPTSEDRDEHGQSMLHFACARSHGRNGLLQLIEESGTSINYRDELYRTARDVSLQASQPDNAKEIDRFVLSLAAKGDLESFQTMVLEGYDHILDITDSDGNTIIQVAQSRRHGDLVEFLNSIRDFEENRENLHSAIRNGVIEDVHQIARRPDGVRLVKAKNYYGRCALHIAVLKENEGIVEFLATNFKQALRIGDNLERTPLHYAMGVSSVEVISRILIRNGAKRVIKDLKGRQASYYFMNKADILRLQEEEEH